MGHALNGSLQTPSSAGTGCATSTRLAARLRPRRNRTQAVVEKGAAEGGKLAIQIGREAFVERAWEWAEYGGVIMS